MSSGQNDGSCGFIVAGRVQGVGFRWWTRRLAARLQLSGTVRNLPDGAVEVRVRGTPRAISELERCLRTGPPTASVERLETFQVTDILPDGFRVIP
jgi:acylphosphatase